MTTRILLLLVMASTLASGAASVNAGPVVAPETAVPKAGEAVLPNPGKTALHRSILPFIEDEYARALDEARARKLPLFIEAWAPW